MGRYTDPITGTPRGGIISPTLANFTLNGLEKTVKESIHPLTRSKEQIMQIPPSTRIVFQVSTGYLLG